MGAWKGETVVCPEAKTIIDKKDSLETLEINDCLHNGPKISNKANTRCKKPFRVKSKPSHVVGFVDL